MAFSTKAIKAGFMRLMGGSKNVTRGNMERIAREATEAAGKSFDDMALGAVKSGGKEFGSIAQDGTVQLTRHGINETFGDIIEDYAKNADNAVNAAVQQTEKLQKLSKAERKAILDEKLGRTKRTDKSSSSRANKNQVDSNRKPIAETREQSSARRRNKRINELTTRELEDPNSVAFKMNLTDAEVNGATIVDSAGNPKKVQSILSKEQRQAYNRGVKAKQAANDAASAQSNAQKIENDVKDRFQQQADEQLKHGQRINEARNSANREKQTERYVGGLKAKIIGAGQDMSEAWKKSGIHKSVRQQRADIQRFINDAGGINGQQVSISQVGNAMKKLDAGASAQDVMDSMIAELAEQNSKVGTSTFDGIIDYFKDNELATAGALVGGGLLVGNLLDSE